MPTQPLVSVFTPSHDPRHLEGAYRSLAAQTYTNFEWVIVPNGDLADDVRRELGRLAGLDDWMRVIDAHPNGPEPTGIGALKHLAAARCSGDILLELDHDDVLATGAIAAVVDAFDEHPEAGLVYSHTVDLNAHGRPELADYPAAAGWATRRARVDGVSVRHHVAMPVNPHNLGYIWYAPNHLRAFTRTAYDAAGGYDPTLEVLDDQDLMARLYEVGDFVLIDEPLYGQRRHPAQSQTDEERNAYIQIHTVALYDRYFERLALTWANRRGLACIDLTWTGEADPRYLRYTHHNRVTVSAGGVGVIRAVDYLHRHRSVDTLNALHQLLAPGGALLTLTPSTDGRGAFQDPRTRSYWNQNSWDYYTEPTLAELIPDFEAPFQTSRLVTYLENDLSYVCANMLAVKDGAPLAGGLNPWRDFD